MKTLPREPTEEMIEAGAQRLARWEDGCVWPDSWDRLQIVGMRQDAERVWLSMYEAAPAVPDDDNDFGPVDLANEEPDKLPKRTPDKVAEAWDKAIRELKG